MANLTLEKILGEKILEEYAFADLSAVHESLSVEINHFSEFGYYESQTEDARMPAEKRRNI